MNTLKLNIEVLPGSDLDDAVRDACRLADDLKLAAVCFEANGYRYTCISDYRTWKALRVHVGYQHSHEWQSNGMLGPIDWGAPL